MTLHVVRRRGRNRPKIKPLSNALAIGELDQTIFACPVCARPLAVGSRRCPACDTRLLMGVQARRAGVFIGIGLAIGVGLSIVAVSAVAGLDRLVRDVAAAVAATGPKAPAAPAATAVPGASPAAGSSAGTAPGATIPPVGRSALVQALTLDQQLVASAAALEAHLKARTLDTAAVSQVLRRMSADALFGLDLSAQLSTWKTSADLGAGYTMLYQSIRTTAGDALGASLRNVDAYRAAARTMVGLRGELQALDAWAREIATAAGVELDAAGSPAP